MAYWMCNSCGHCANDSMPPDACPHCGEKCSFGDVTCYRPECGGEHNTDPLLTGSVKASARRGVDSADGGAVGVPDLATPLWVSHLRNRGPEW